MSGNGAFTNIEDVAANAGVYQDKRVPDELRDDQQRFCVCSIVAPEGTDQKCAQLAMRVYGCKGSMSAANAWAKKLRDNNPFYTVYVVQCHEWAALPPRLDAIGEMHSNEERVQSIVEQYVEEEKGRKRELEEKLDAAHRHKTLSPEEIARAEIKRGEDMMREALRKIKENRAVIDGGGSEQEPVDAPADL